MVVHNKMEPEFDEMDREVQILLMYHFKFFDVGTKQWYSSHEIPMGTHLFNAMWAIIQCQWSNVWPSNVDIYAIPYEI